MHAMKSDLPANGLFVDESGRSLSITINICGKERRLHFQCPCVSTGIGYYLDIEKRRLSKAKSIRAICQYFCPNCVVLEDSLKRSIFLLPSSSDTTPVENILDCLEQNQIDLGIANYDLVGSTLENAFIK